MPAIPVDAWDTRTPHMAAADSSSEVNTGLKSLFTGDHICVILVSVYAFLVRYMEGAFAEFSTSTAAGNLTRNAAIPSRSNTSNATTWNTTDTPTSETTAKCNVHEEGLVWVALFVLTLVYADIHWKSRRTQQWPKVVLTKKSLLFFVYLATTHSQPISCLLDNTGNATLSYIQGSLLIVIALAALLAHVPALCTDEDVSSATEKVTAKGHQVDHSDAFIVALYHAIIKFTQPTVHAECSDARTGLALAAFFLLSAAAKFSHFICVTQDTGACCNCKLEFRESFRDISKQALAENLLRTLGIMAYLLSSHAHPLSCLLDATELNELSYAQSGIAGLISVTAIISRPAA